MSGDPKIKKSTEEVEKGNGVTFFLSLRLNILKAWDETHAFFVDRRGNQTMAFPVTKLEMERRKRFMSQWDLARLTGIIQTRLSLIERGQVKAKRQEIEEISKTFGIPFDEVEDLFRGGGQCEQEESNQGRFEG